MRDERYEMKGERNDFHENSKAQPSMKIQKHNPT
jgi:hypothetical protein